MEEHVGYARVSTGEQKMDLQLDALKEAGCDKIFTDRLSGATTDRPGLEDAIEYARPGDTLVVWRLDRFGRSLKDLVAKVERLGKKEVGFRSLKENIDTTPSAGKLQFHIFSALAEFERDLNRERTMVGLRAAPGAERGGPPAGAGAHAAAGRVKAPETASAAHCEGRTPTARSSAACTAGTHSREGKLPCLFLQSS